jgi:hypothetical protein
VRIRIILFAARQEPAPLEKPQGRTAGPALPGRTAISTRKVAQGSLSSLAALPPRRGLGGVARENSDYLVGGAARTRDAGNAAGPESGPCATRSDRDFHKKTGSARLVFQPCGSSTAPRGWRRGPCKFGLPCRQRGFGLFLSCGLSPILGAARRVRIRIILFAARQEPAPLEKPQGRRAGPALPGRTAISARPSAVKEPLTTPYAW